MATIVKITEAELLDALAQAASGNGPEEARTVRELCLETGMRDDRVREALHAYKAQGRLAAHTVYREGLDGRMAKVTGYTVRPAAKKAKR